MMRNCRSKSGNISLTFDVRRKKANFRVRFFSVRWWKKSGNISLTFKVLLIMSGLCIVTRQHMGLQDRAQDRLKEGSLSCGFCHFSGDYQRITLYTFLYKTGKTGKNEKFP